MLRVFNVHLTELKLNGLKNIYLSEFKNHVFRVMYNRTGVVTKRNSIIEIDCYGLYEMILIYVCFHFVFGLIIII